MISSEAIGAIYSDPGNSSTARITADRFAASAILPDGRAFFQQFNEVTRKQREVCGGTTIYAAKATPAAIVDKLHAQTGSAVETDEVREGFTA